MTTARCGIRKHRYFDDVDQYYLGKQHEVMGQQKEVIVEDDKKEASYSQRAKGAAEILVALSKIDLSFEPKDSTRALQFQCALPFRVYVPKRRRGSCGRSLPHKGAQNTAADDDDDEQEVKGSIDINAVPVDGLGFQKTQFITTEPESKIHLSTTVGGFIVRPLGIHAPKKKIKADTRVAFGKENDDLYCNISAAQEVERREIKVCRKRVPKRGREEDDQVQGSSKNRRIDFEKVGLDPPPNYSSHIKSRIDYQEDRDSELKLRIMKQLFSTDLKTHQGRFTMPWKQIRDLEEFLNEDEMIVGAEFEVKLLEVGLKGADEVHESTMRLSNWRMSNNICCALRSGWNDVLARNQGELKENDIVQVYSFRRDNKLRLVLFKVMGVEEVKRRLMATDQVGRNSSTQVNNGGNCMMM